MFQEGEVMNKNIEANHDVILKDRTKLEITGVKKIESLNEEEFYIVTNMDDLIVHGENLEMLHLDIEKGHLWITGYVYALEYRESGRDTPKQTKKKSSFFGKIFK